MTAREKATKRLRQTQHPEVTESMDLWVSLAMSRGILLTGEVLRKKWKEFAEKAGVALEDQLQLSNGWLDRFKARHGLKEVRRHGEAGSVKMDTVEAERLRIQKVIRDGGYQLRDVFNMDETGLFYQYVSHDLGH